MGKLVTLFSMLTFTMLFFWLAYPSMSLGWLDLILHPELITASGFFTSLFTNGIGLLIGGGVILVGALWLKNDLVINAGIAIGIGGPILQGFVSLYNILKVENSTFALIVVGPLAVLLAFIIIEWFRGKD